MKLVEFVPPVKHPLWKLCLQMGITEVIIKVNPDLTGLPDPWKYETLKKIVDGLAAEGLTVVGLEGDPFDMSPIKEYGAVVGVESSSSRENDGNTILQYKIPTPTQASASLRLCVKNQNSDLREEALAHYRELLESMSRLGIKLLCYNFMVGTGWARTGVREGRGGAKATYFSLRDLSTGLTGLSGLSDTVNNPVNLVNPVKKHNLIISHDQVWANYEYFIKSVMPTAEKYGIRMGLHPDDPCLDSLGGYARIFGSIEAYDRAYAIYPSPSNAVTFCQANFKLMFSDDPSQTAEPNSSADSASSRLCVKNNPTETLCNVARHFGKRIAFIHVRDVEGDKTDFTELFHDQGDIDQFALMRTYRELGLDVPVRGDHVPEMAYDRELTPEGTPGYFTLGRLFANGYLTALMKGTGNMEGFSHKEQKKQKTKEEILCHR